MKYTEAIKNGFAIVNKNWQLVMIQVGAMFLSFIGFFILVIVPLAIAFIIFGLDLTELSSFGDVWRTFKEPSEILSRYFALVILVLASILLYALIVLAFGIFLFGGSIGVIGRSVKGEAERVHMKIFISEGKRLFFPLIGFTSLIGLIFILVAFILGLFGGSIAAIVSLAKEQEAALALFLGIFFSLILFVVGLALILITLSTTIYGAAIMALRGLGPMKSFKEAIRYLYKQIDALYLYIMIFVGYIIISVIVVFLSYPIKYIPLIGSFMALFYKFGIYIFQSYTGLVMIAAIFRYYYLSTISVPPAEESSPGAPPISETSTPEKGIAESQVHGQGELPPDKEVHE